MTTINKSKDDPADKVGVLYQWLFPQGKRYLGISSNFKRRTYFHIRAASLGSTFPFHRAIRKHGHKKIKISILAVARMGYLKELEIAAIENFGTRVHREGYNVTLGGDLSPSLSPEVSAKFKGKGRLGKANGMYGKQHSRMARKRMSASGQGKRTGKGNGMFGKKHSPETIAKMADRKRGDANPMSALRIRSRSKPGR